MMVLQKQNARGNEMMISKRPQIVRKTLCVLNLGSIQSHNRETDDLFEKLRAKREKDNKSKESKARERRGIPHIKEHGNDACQNELHV